MSRLTTSVLSYCLVALLLIATVTCDDGLQVGRKRKPQNNGIRTYDHLVLSQMWPQTSCWDVNRQWSAAEDSCSICKLPYNGWTIHGLWPSNYHGKHPGYCQGNAFQANALSSELKAELTKKWPSYKFQTRTESFWGYEYKKHGSCATDLDSTNSVSKYFSKGLELLKKYDVGKALQQSNIHPGQSYDVRDINQALKRAFGKNTWMQCKTNPDTGVQYVVQVSVCFNKSFGLADCSENSKKTSNCALNKGVMYPENMKSC